MKKILVILLCCALLSALFGFALGGTKTEGASIERNFRFQLTPGTAANPSHYRIFILADDQDKQLGTKLSGGKREAIDYFDPDNSTENYYVLTELNNLLAPYHIIIDGAD